MTEIVIPPRGGSAASVSAGVATGGAEKYGRRQSLQPLAWAASRLILWLLLAGCFLSTARVAKTYFGVYPVSPTLVVSPEPERWALSSYPIVKLARFINQSVADEARIMVFRQSDIAYYTDNPIVTFASDEQAALFEEQTPAALHAALLARNIRYVAVPSYGMAEINRSAFKPLLNEGHYAALAFEADGEKLFEIYGRRRDLERVDNLSENVPDADVQTFARVRDVDFSSPAETEDWTAFLKPTGLTETLRFGPPSLSKPFSGTAGSVRMDRDRPIVARPSLIDVLQAWPLQRQYAPIVRADTEFPVENGIYRISGRVEAKGKATLYLRITTMGANQVQHTNERVLWSEVLDGEATQLKSTTAIAMPELGQPLSHHRALTSAMLYFTLEQGGYLDVSALSVDRLETPETGFFALLARRAAAQAGGWTLDNPEYGGLYARPLDLFSRTAWGGIRFKQASAAPETLISPPYIVSDAQVGVLEALSLERRAQQSPPRMTLEYRAEGQGALHIRLFGYCTDGEPFSDDVRTYSLTPGGKNYTVSGELSCVPSLTRAAFTLSRDKFLYPPNFERGEAVLSDLSMTLTMWDNDGQQRAMALRAAPELSPHDESAVPVPVADLALPDVILPDFDR